MPVILKLDTKPSLFEPDEVEIDGKKYRVKELTLGDLEKIQVFQPDLDAGSAAAIVKTIGMLLEGDTAKIVQKLQMKKVQTLVKTLTERAVRLGDEEKNGSGPGAES